MTGTLGAAIRRRLSLVVIVFAFAATSCSDSGPGSVPEFPSIIQVLGNLERFHGERVRVAGFAVLEFEHHVLYLHQEDAKHSLLKNGLWLDLHKATRNSSSNFNRRYVLVDGMVNSQETGHMGLFAATLQNAQIVKVLSEGKDR